MFYHLCNKNKLKYLLLIPILLMLAINDDNNNSLICKNAISFKNANTSFLFKEEINFSSENNTDKENIDFLFKNILEEMTMCLDSNNNPIYHHFCRIKGNCKTNAKKYAEYIYYSAIEFDLDPWLLAAVALHESGFDAYKVGGVGEKTIFQLNPKSPWGRKSYFVRNKLYRDFCKKSHGHCQKRASRIAAKLLRDHINETGFSIERALTMYNTGKGKHIRRTYVKQVFNNRNRLLNPNKIHHCSGKY